MNGLTTPGPRSKQVFVIPFNSQFFFSIGKQFSRKSQNNHIDIYYFLCFEGKLWLNKVSNMRVRNEHNKMQKSNRMELGMYFRMLCHINYYLK